MQVYNYNEVTGYLVSVSLADQDPLDQDNYLIPAHATTIEPPHHVEGKIRVFNKNSQAWFYIDDPALIPEEPEEPVKPEEHVPTVEDVVAERRLRLTAGFEYTFPDERGAHFISTSEEDMKNWDEVSKVATAAVLSGYPDAQIAINTGTGGVTVTAMEWQAILIAAGNVRQPIFQASFALQAMDPIPEDYRDDKYWVTSEEA